VRGAADKTDSHRSSRQSAELVAILDESLAAVTADLGALAG